MIHHVDPVKLGLSAVTFTGVVVGHIDAIDQVLRMGASVVAIISGVTVTLYTINKWLQGK